MLNPVRETQTPETTAAAAAEQLKARWHSLRSTEPGLRARELAAKLQVSEAQLVACRCGDGVVALHKQWPRLIQAMPGLGRVMVLTRNDSCVHEKKGSFGHISMTHSMGLVLNDAIDLRLFLNHWVHGFAVREEAHGRVLHSLQIFDADGQAVHKIYAVEETDPELWQSFIDRFAASQQPSWLVLQPVASRDLQQYPDSHIDQVQLQADWSQLRDPHQFVGLLRRHQLGRLQALHLVGPRWARPVSGASIEEVLQFAAASGLELMVFVASAGVVQIHSGPIRKVMRAGPWLNVLDDDFNLHLRLDQVASSWVVRKPGPDGEVTALELFDEQDRLVLQVFGLRKPGRPELNEWRLLADGLTAQGEVPV